MKFEFPYRGTKIQLEIDPARIASVFSHLEKARKEIGRLARGDQALADRAIARWIMNATEHAGGKWSAMTAAVLDTLHVARENLTTIFENVVGGESPRVDKVREELAHLDQSLEKLISPDKWINKEHVGPPPSQAQLANPISDFTIKTAIGDQVEAFGKLSSSQQSLVRELVDADAGSLRKAVVAATETAFESSTPALREKLSQKGRNSGEIDAAIRAVEELNKSRRNEMANNLPPDHIRMLAKKLGELQPEKLREAVLKSPLLQELAYPNSEMLRSMWEAYEKKGATYPFEDYVTYVQRHLRGLHGEYQLAFSFGDGWVLLKGPDAKVTIPGTDAVALNLKTGEVLLLDNKCLASIDPLNTVDALTRNLPKNIAKDAAEFQAKVGTGPETPVQVSAAISRIKEAAAAIKKITSGMTKDKISEEPVQKMMQKELEDRGIFRAVGNAGGNTTSLADRLQRIGVSLRNVNAPLKD